MPLAVWALTISTFAVVTTEYVIVRLIQRSLDGQLVHEPNNCYYSAQHMSRIADNLWLTHNFNTWNLMYIWEWKDWQGRGGPSFHWQPEVLQPRLDEVAARRAQLIAQHESLSVSQEVRASSEELDAAQVNALIASVLRSSEIEGEHLDAASPRSSLIT